MYTSKKALIFIIFKIWFISHTKPMIIILKNDILCTFLKHNKPPKTASFHVKNVKSIISVMSILSITNTLMSKI